MKRKIFRISLILVLVISLSISIGSSVKATEQKSTPVAWVTHSRAFCNHDKPNQGGFVVVKLLADGTTVGNVLRVDYCTGDVCDMVSFDNSATKFYRNGDAKVAEIIGEMRQPDGSQHSVKMVLVDNDESGTNTDTAMYFNWRCVWLPNLGIPFPMWWTDPMWWPVEGPQDPADPAFGLLVPIEQGDIQVHLPE